MPLWEAGVVTSEVWVQLIGADQRGEVRKIQVLYAVTYIGLVDLLYV